MNYHKFWEELSHAYPISKGELRLPIIRKIQKAHTFFDEKFLPECEKILKNILKHFENENFEKIFSQEWDEKILALLRKNFTGIIRFDCMLNHENKPKIIEINADYPDGIILHDATFSVLSGIKNSLHQENFCKLFDKNKNIFIAYPQNAFFQDAYYSEFLALKNAWFSVFYGNYEDLTRKDNKIFYKNFEIHTIRRYIETGKMNNEHFFLLNGTNVDFIGSFDLRALGYKSVLSRISHEYIPQSFILHKENLKKFFEKNLWIAKPSNLSEGHGIIIGADVEADFWKNFLEKNIENNYIIQEFIETRKENFEFFDNEKVITKNVYFDFCPHFFVKNGKIIGRGHTLMRFSENKILNVAQGGGIGYMQ